ATASIRSSISRSVLVGRARVAPMCGTYSAKSASGTWQPRKNVRAAVRFQRVGPGPPHAGGRSGDPVAFARHKAHDRLQCSRAAPVEKKLRDAVDRTYRTPGCSALLRSPPGRAVDPTGRAGPVSDFAGS